MTTFRTQAAPAPRWSFIAAPPLFPAISGLSLLLAAGLLFAGRRIAVGHTAPLSLLATLATAVAIVLIVVALQWTLRPTTSNQFSNRLLSLAPPIVIGFWAVACSFPGSQPAAWFIWASAIGLVFMATKNFAKRPPLTAVVADHAPLSPVATAQSQDGSADLQARHPVDEGETVLQNVLRVRDQSGQEYVYATLRGEFKPGDRIATLYVGFCPPFPSLPHVEAEVIDGAPAVAKVIQALHNGAQIEVDLDEPSLEATHVTVEVAAFEPLDE
ncbi:MAG: hypothetical protein ACR2NU_16735 [Aeoliella sp.]